ncbi:MAG: class I SAM-dependent methyltransferase [Candidatus Paraprevotella stercoravium]|jgi:SAM-dependent methyltransferase|uniref:Class I SAM-dependent methyltransferase n=2 Tax=Bacteroidales TaxID=171549 RepID=A0ABT7U3Q0_9BACE|nr:class I SAM-dependent methyltransferase [Candidatus Paraprevotella stercoravium]MDM8145147.1 class I SAM-dependent methyltransferase [Bacteroides eggerthii]
MFITVLDSTSDPMGTALQEYIRKGKASKLRVLSSLFDEDELPVSLLFRKEKDMSDIERAALDLARGHVLDVGAGAGCHTLALQNKGLEVTAIDISPLSVQVQRERGVRDARLVNLFDPTFAEQYDTILFLMNGSGIIGKLENMPAFFDKMKLLLAKGGRIYMDSSDLRYIFENEDGSMDIDLNAAYYGEVDYQMKYRNIAGPKFDWLYIDFETLSYYASEYGFTVTKILEGSHYDYLACIERQK